MFDLVTSGTGTFMVPGILVCPSMVLSSSGGGRWDIPVGVGALNAADGLGSGLFCFPLDFCEFREDLEDFPVRVRDLVAGGPV